MTDVLFVASALGVFIAILVGVGLLIVGLALVWGRAIDEDNPMFLDPIEDMDTVTVLPRIDFDLNEEPGDG